MEETKIFCDECGEEMDDDKLVTTILSLHNDFCSEDCAKKFLERKPSLKKLILNQIPEDKLIWTHKNK